MFRENPQRVLWIFSFSPTITTQCYHSLVSAAKIYLVFHPLLLWGGWHSLPQARAFILAFGINCLGSSNASIMGLSICKRSKVNLSLPSLVLCEDEKHEIISRGGTKQCFAQCHDAEWRSQPNILLSPKAAEQLFLSFPQLLGSRYSHH